jgi:hypothetical protein
MAAVTTYPEHPLECGDGGHHQTLEEQTQSALATCQSTIKQTDARNDQPDDEACATMSVSSVTRSRGMQVDAYRRTSGTCSGPEAQGTEG